MAIDRKHNVAGVASERLRSIVSRIERLEEERKALGEDIKDVYLEAKSAGYDVKALRQLIRIRKQDENAYEELELLVDTYRRALGLFDAETSEDFDRIVKQQSAAAPPVEEPSAGVFEMPDVPGLPN